MKIQIFKIKLSKWYKYLNYRFTQVTLYARCSHIKCSNKFLRGGVWTPHLVRVGSGDLPCLFTLIVFEKLHFCVPGFTDCVLSFSQNSAQKIIKCLKKDSGQEPTDCEGTAHDKTTRTNLTHLRARNPRPILLIQTLF